MLQSIRMVHREIQQGFRGKKFFVMGKTPLLVKIIYKSTIWHLWRVAKGVKLSLHSDLCLSQVQRCLRDLTNCHPCQDPKIIPLKVSMKNLVIQAIMTIAGVEF